MCGMALLTAMRGGGAQRRGTCGNEDRELARARRPKKLSTTEAALRAKKDRHRALCSAYTQPSRRCRGSHPPIPQVPCKHEASCPASCGDASRKTHHARRITLSLLLYCRRAQSKSCCYSLQLKQSCGCARPAFSLSLSPSRAPSLENVHVMHVRRVACEACMCGEW